MADKVYLCRLVEKSNNNISPYGKFWFIAEDEQSAVIKFMAHLKRGYAYSLDDYRLNYVVTVNLDYIKYGFIEAEHLNDKPEEVKPAIRQIDIED